MKKYFLIAITSVIMLGAMLTYSVSAESKVIDRPAIKYKTGSGAWAYTYFTGSNNAGIQARPGLGQPGDKKWGTWSTSKSPTLYRSYAKYAYIGTR